MASSSTTGLYRSLLRELRLSSLQPRATRNTTIQTHIRSVVTSLSASSDREAQTRVLEETRDFIRATRIHAELLKRYNPLHDMSQAERVHATARRVGLDSPKEYKPE